MATFMATFMATSTVVQIQHASSRAVPGDDQPAIMPHTTAPASKLASEDLASRPASKLASKFNSTLATHMCYDPLGYHGKDGTSKQVPRQRQKT
jgi:hypothetical protein